MTIKKALAISYVALSAICVPIYYMAPGMINDSSQDLETYQGIIPVAKKNTVSTTSHKFGDQTITNLSNHSSTQGLENIFAFE